MHRHRDDCIRRVFAGWRGSETSGSPSVAASPLPRCRCPRSRAGISPLGPLLKYPIIRAFNRSKFNVRSSSPYNRIRVYNRQQRLATGRITLTVRRVDFIVKRIKYNVTEILFKFIFHDSFDLWFETLSTLSTNETSFLRKVP